MKNDLKALVIKLRKEQGLSYKEIREQVSVSKGSLSLWLRDIALTKEQEERLYNKRVANGRAYNFTPEQCYRGGINCQGRHGERVQQNLVQDYTLANLAYRKDELPIKERLEFITQQSFTKEKINEKYVDFANESYLIEHTTDHTKGLSEAIDRLSGIEDDREKILICKSNRLGLKRRAEGIRYINLEEFWSNDSCI